MKSFKAFIDSKKRQGKIYCDLDGVLVDLMGWFCVTYTPPTCKPIFIDRYFEAAKPEMVKEHPHMYRDLPWTKDGKQLWAYIGKHNPNILSAYSETFKNSPADKLVWISNNLRPSPNQKHIVLRKQKQLYAVQKDGTPNILIDDFAANTKEWTAKGGVAIHHKDAASTIAQLGKLGL